MFSKIYCVDVRKIERIFSRILCKYKWTGKGMLEFFVPNISNIKGNFLFISYIYLYSYLNIIYFIFI